MAFEGYIPAIVVETLRSSHNLAVFIRIGTTPSLNVWLGINDIPAGIVGKDPGGQIYLGGGRIGGVPDLEILINGVADRVLFELSGIDPETNALIDSEIPPVKNKEVIVGITCLDDRYQPVSNIIPIWRGLASYTTESTEPTTNTDSPTVKKGLSVGTGNTARSRATAVTWSEAHQLALYPGDLFCSNTSRIERGVAPVFPRF